jgi:non-ribosomal peptide synthetase component F
VYYNLYGPTETNVCTFALLPPVVPDDRDMPFPSDRPADTATLVLDQARRDRREGLYISGPSVFSRYWNRPENAAAFSIAAAALVQHRRWCGNRGGFTYLGR